MSNLIDFVIVGQGIAGSVLHYYLENKGFKVLVFDNGNINSASHVAAGIVNPITGKRFVKSWKFEEIDEEARSFYHEISILLKDTYLIETPIYRVLHTAQMVNSWDSKIVREEYARYLSAAGDIGAYTTILNSETMVGVTSGSYRIDTQKFLADYRSYLFEKQSIRPVQFDESSLVKIEDGWSYDGLKFKNLIYANGYRSSTSKFWDYLPFNLSKAEILHAQVSHDFNGILKNKIFIVPMSDNLIWIGSSNEWEFSDEKPTQEAKDYLSNKLSENFKDFKPDIIQQRSAIRPTIDDRRPLIGRHPQHKDLYIFNGMGTKGFSMAPFLAKQLVEFISSNKQLDQEVDINRFQ